MSDCRGQIDCEPTHIHTETHIIGIYQSNWPSSETIRFEPFAVSFVIHKFNKAFCNQLPFRRLLCSLVIRGVYESFNVLLKCMNITHD